MCGIAGMCGRPSEDALKQMVKALHHRGPDDHGLIFDANVALGMARLSVIDLSPLGHQPMSTPDGLVTIVYNGEVYNFKEQRGLLESRGVSFRSQSDTEVVLRLYEQYGDDFLLRLRGMFALAIYDRRAGRGKERLLLARDHLGIKPLLYCETPRGLVFASELRALLASGYVERKLDADAIRQLLTFGSIIQPRTAVANVRMLPPGSRLLMENGRHRIERFWSLNPQRRDDLSKADYEDLVGIVSSSIQESVRLQMVSDVPLGAFLSGGVDSSLLVAAMTAVSGRKLKTYSVGYDAAFAAIDETADAAKLAAYIGTDHTRVSIDGNDVRQHIMAIAAGLDQPTVDGVNSYFVSWAARKDVTVAISGTGGDELFAGYPWFLRMVEFAEDAKRRPVKAFLKERLSGLASSTALDSWGFRRGGGTIQRLRNHGSFRGEYASQYQIFGALDTAAVLSGEYRARSAAGRAPAADIALADELSAGSPVQRVTALCTRGYLLNQLLRDIDAASMAHSLEVRVPFIDPIVADIALALPDSAKIGRPTRPAHGEITYAQSGAKRILIDIAERNQLLPKGIGNQPKRGFQMPFGHWLKTTLSDVLEDTLSEASVAKRGLFDPGGVRRLRHQFKNENLAWPRPWLLMMTELWCRAVIDGAPV